MAEESAPRPGWLWGPYAGFAGRIALVTLGLDQVHKWWMLLGLKIEEGQRFRLTPFLDVVFVINKGISYSLLTQSSYTGQVLLALFAVIASVAMWIWLNQGSTGKLMAAGLGLIIGGAIGNAIDRIIIGGVADFFSLHAFGFYWYVFNIADVAIVAGVAALLYDSFVASRNDAAKSL